MDNAPIPPLQSFVNGYRKKMATHTTVFLTSKSMFIVLRSRTSPMQIGRLNINVIFHPYQPLNFVIFLQCERIHLNITGEFYPVDAPSILFLEFFQKRAALDFKDHSFLDFPCLGVLEARDDFVEPNVDTAAILRILHLLLLSAYKHKKAGL